MIFWTTYMLAIQYKTRSLATVARIADHTVWQHAFIMGAGDKDPYFGRTSVRIGSAIVPLNRAFVSS